jgi:hypothetical protein
VQKRRTMANSWADALLLAPFRILNAITWLCHLAPRTFVC